MSGLSWKMRKCFVFSVTCKHWKFGSLEHGFFNGHAVFTPVTQQPEKHQRWVFLVTGIFISILVTLALRPHFRE